MDVLNPGGNKSNSGGSPPPGPPAMMSGPPQPFSGTFFVPSQPPGTCVERSVYMLAHITLYMN